MPAPKASEKAIGRALAAAQGAGLAIKSFSVCRDGTVHVECEPATESKDLACPAESGQVVQPRQWQTG